jgi:nitroreductase
MDVAQAIRTKRAVREFTEQPLSDDAVRAILNAGRLSQSSKNSQPWQFVAIRDRNTLRRLSECGAYAGHLAGAALGIALVSSEEWAFDLGQASAYMQLAAWEMGIGSCIASMWEPDKAKAILGIPAPQHFDTAISFGYPRHARRPRSVPGGRLPFDEVVRWEHWESRAANPGTSL